MNAGLQLIITLGAIVIALVSLAGVVYTAKSGRRANTEDRDAVWNAGYRAGAEPHLYWDLDRAADIRQLRDVVNHLEEKLGEPLTQFQPIPDAPPLFPKL